MEEQRGKRNEEIIVIFNPDILTTLNYSHPNQQKKEEADVQVHSTLVSGTSYRLL